ncbi:hypothetical protein [Frigoribacterium sp. PhB118]|uniref:hypothetical protein n=1 Tax=Frigoribacterium sp. PhB118 TaxID=2485175 RepID=UPI0011CDFC03|nr:hypothetical protein [Frigoribacterium sp. PhB118]
MDLQVGSRVFGEDNVEGNIADLMVALDGAELYVSLRLASGLIKIKDSWDAELASHEDRESFKKTRLLTAAEVRSLRTTSSTLREAMIAEGEGKVAFIASDGRYAVGKLLNDIGTLMSPDVFASLPTIAQKDLEEAGKAMAFDLPTAAAFHILRATEAALRQFYAKVTSKNRISEPWMWAAMLAHIRASETPPPAVLLVNLDSLRANFRNPTQHPEMTYEMDEVQDLFALAVDSMNRMARYTVPESEIDRPSGSG